MRKEKAVVPCGHAVHNGETLYNLIIGNLLSKREVTTRVSTRLLKQASYVIS